MRKQFRLNFILVATLLLSYSASGIHYSDDNDDKPGVVKGIILDNSTGQPMEYANVALYNMADSSLITGGITNFEGNFEINGLGIGEYFLEANFIGYEKSRVDQIYIANETPVYDAGVVKLNSSDLVLGAVDVVADKVAVEYKMDKKVVNVSQVISAVGGTAVDVLENTPSVQVDIEGNVSLRGSSNFTVLIDGRPSVLSGSDALRQIPASALENIEIITNPSAKYEPDGMAGIINLVMKKNVMNGFSGIINATVGTGDKYRGDFTLNYRAEKFNIFAGADWRDETNYGRMVSTRESWANDTTSFLDMDGSRDFIRGGHSFKGGIEIFLSENSAFTISGEAGESRNSAVGNGKIHSYTQPASEEVFSVSGEESSRENNFYSFNLNFQHQFNNEGHKIEAMAFYSDETGSDDETEEEILSDSRYQKTNTYLDRVLTRETEDETEFRFKLDYTLPISEEERLEAGLQSRMDREYEDFSFQNYDPETDSWIDNSLYTSSTDFRRDIHAIYTTYSNQLGGLQFMAGLRGELTVREIINSNIAEASQLNRFDIFPTLHLSYNIGKLNELMASYSRRINRPRGRELDPSAGYWNRYTIRYGNPDLKPEFTDSYELGAMKRFGRSFISLDAFRRITHNKIDRIATLGEDGIYYQSPDNFDKDFATGLELTGNVNFTEWLLVNASISMFNYKITGEINGESIDRESTNWTGRMNTTLKFAQNSRMQIQGFYRGPSVSAQGESKAMVFSNISYRHDFYNKKLTATLSVRDPLGTARFERESYGENFNSYFRWKREPRVVMLTLSYKINNFKSDERRGNDPGGGGMDFDGGEF